MVKLFGFKLVNASALLLFIGSAIMLIFGLYVFYLILEYYNAYGTVPPLHLIIFLICMIFSIYIFYKTLVFRKKATRMNK